MTDEQRAVLVWLIAEMIYVSRKGVTREIAEVRAIKSLSAIEPAIRADERERCIRLVYGHAGSDNDATRIAAAIRALKDKPS